MTLQPVCIGDEETTLFTYCERGEPREERSAPAGPQSLLLLFGVGYYI